MTPRKWFSRAGVQSCVLLSCSVAVPVFASAQTTALPRANPEEVGFSSNGIAQIVPALRTSFVDSGKIPGFVVAVARHGRLVLYDSVGFMDIEARTPMMGSAVFRIMSMTKPITSVAVMKLVEQGKLRLEDPVAKYIPAFEALKVQLGSDAASRRLADPATAVTIEHLLTHTAGLTRAGAMRNFSATIADFADSIAAVPLLFHPGTSWSYSSATDVLGRVVEVASGRSFDRYLADEVFAPLGMRDTGFHVTPAMDGRIPRVYSPGADGHLVPGAQLLDRRYQPDAKLFSGGGGLLSTIPDFLRFAQMLLNGGELDGQRILQRSSVSQIMTNQVPAGFAAEIARLAPGWLLGTYGFGYGGAVRIDSATAVPGSPGTFRWGGSNTTMFLIDPRENVVAMIWAQFEPPTIIVALDNQFQRLVYAAMDNSDREGRHQ